jgi:hypothetical protein
VLPAETSGLVSGNSPGARAPVDRHSAPLAGLGEGSLDGQPASLEIDALPPERQGFGARAQPSADPDEARDAAGLRKLGLPARLVVRLVVALPERLGARAARVT